MDGDADAIKRQPAAVDYTATVDKDAECLKHADFEKCKRMH